MKSKGCHNVGMDSHHSGQGGGPCSSSKNLWCSQVGVGAQSRPHGSPNVSEMLVDHL